MFFHFLRVFLVFLLWQFWFLFWPFWPSHVVILFVFSFTCRGLAWLVFFFLYHSFFFGPFLFFLLFTFFPLCFSLFFPFYILSFLLLSFSFSYFSLLHLDFLSSSSSHILVCYLCENWNDKSFSVILSTPHLCCSYLCFLEFGVVSSWRCSYRTVFVL